MAKKTAVPKPTPQVEGGKTQKNKYDQAVFQQNLFIVMALNMSWQLAFVVIIPLVGGYKLDEHFDTSPVYTIIGLILAIGASFAVLYRVLREARVRAGSGKEDKK
ncbi:MAG TPA: AtpZ/AtpI family protein [Candidatus Saccharimonadales bacterium]|nr:AtpZ/AtpI family protein [Candidatus Saccharimonadales bacterium]